MADGGELRSAARRDWLRQLFWSSGLAMVGGVPALAQASMGAPRVSARSPLHRLGPLLPPDAQGIRLPQGFRSRVVAVSGSRPAGARGDLWHAHPDGGATFLRPGSGWIYVSNSEVARTGGVGALYFNARGEVVDARRLLEGTTLNCAGGRTPWNTWLSGEEFDQGRIWEVDPLAPAGSAQVRPALGVFRHEAAAVDPVRKVVYLTEDHPSGRFYRFACDTRDWPARASRAQLIHGRLQVMRLRALKDNQSPGPDMDLMRPQPVEWIDVIQADQPQGIVRQQLGDRAPGTPFKGGEGLWCSHGVAWFSTKGDDRIWALDAERQTLEVIYDFARAQPPDNVLSGVDNVTVSPWGEVVVAEDGGNMELCVIHPDHHVDVLLQVVGQDHSELTGPAFSPDGSRLYVSSQRGGELRQGITYEISWA